MVSHWHSTARLFLIVAIIGCSWPAPREHQDEGHLEKKIYVYIERDSIGLAKDISFRIYTKPIGLVDLRNGYDSLAIRIWYWGYDTSYVIDIKYNNGRYKCDIFRFRMEEIEMSSAWFFVYKTKENVKPEWGWERFMSFLNKKQIKTLPSDYPLIKEVAGLTGGFIYQFEIATSDSYRTYRYVNPFLFETSYWQAKNVVSILDFISQQFDLPPIDKTKY